MLGANTVALQQMETTKRPINQGYAVDVPDACPTCHRHSEVALIVSDEVDGGKGVQAVFRCGYLKCRSFFICSYGPKPSSDLLSVRPLRPPENSLSEVVSKVSPMFASIFIEANEAKYLGLRQVAGPGFRKAFEFLIKDYAKSLEPEKTKEIEESFSGNVVKSFIKEARIQNVAERCLWLGNDETHYLRKWADRDVDDLVNLIKLAMHWIEIDHLSKSCVKEMPSK